MTVTLGIPALLEAKPGKGPLSRPVTSNGGAGRPLTAVTSRDCVASQVPGRFTDRALWAQLIRHARCAAGGLDPDQWFPVSSNPDRAREEAAAALAVCSTCPVRDQCLALSLRHWDIGQHGIWGGLVAADRARLRRRLPAVHIAGRGIAVARGESEAVIPLARGRPVRSGEVRVNQITEGEQL